MSEVKEKKWYVVRSVSGQENKIKDYIEREISHHGLEDFVDQILVPTEKVIQIRNGKKVNEEKRKLEVMVKIFGRKTPLELSYMQVEKV